MKKWVSLLLCLLLLMTFAGCSREEKRAEEICTRLAAEYDAYLEEFEYERDLYTVKAVSYEINGAEATVTDTYFCVDVTWYVDVDDRNDIIRNILLSELSSALPSKSSLSEPSSPTETLKSSLAFTPTPADVPFFWLTTSA